MYTELTRQYTFRLDGSTTSIPAKNSETSFHRYKQINMLDYLGYNKTQKGEKMSNFEKVQKTHEANTCRYFLQGYCKITADYLCCMDNEHHTNLCTKYDTREELNKC